MTDNKFHMPDPETSQKLLANLRRTHLEIQEFNLELEQITAKLEEDRRKQRLQRVRRSLSELATDSKDSESSIG